MKVLVAILAILFIAVFWSANAQTSTAHLRLRNFLLACTLSAVVLVQLFFLTPKPYVNYFSIGWEGAIRELNRVLMQEGNPNRIPEPEED